LFRPIVTRADFQELAEERLTEAKILLDAGKWDSAYYLAGYAVELALKACIIKTLMATDAFPAIGFSRSCYTHDVGKLVELARLEIALNAATAADPKLKSNWELAEEWSEEGRYQRVDQADAELLYTAVAESSHGVLPWMKIHW
jgi:hypothetical protein